MDIAGLHVHFISPCDQYSVFRRGRHVNGITKLVYGDIEN